MYITKDDLRKGVCRNGHAIVEGSHYTMQATRAVRCRLCRNESAQRWKNEHPEEAKAKKLQSRLKQRYGITTSREELLASQGSGCAICGRTDCHWGKGYNDVWHIDHDPTKPGTYRGILCAWCNTALGRLEPVMANVAAYLEKSCR